MWTTNRVSMSSAPWSLSSKYFEFDYGAIWQLDEDTQRKVLQELADGSSRRYDFGVPLPNVTLQVQPWLTGSNLADNLDSRQFWHFEV